MTPIPDATYVHRGIPQVSVDKDTPARPPISPIENARNRIGELETAIASVQNALQDMRNYRSEIAMECDNTEKRFHEVTSSLGPKATAVNNPNTAYNSLR